MLRLAGFSLLFVATMGIAHADLIHSFNFDSSLTDSVGAANGTIVGSATVSGGQLVLNGGYVQFDAHIVPTSGSYSVSLDFQLASTDNPGITEFISQGSSGGPGFYLGTNGFGFRATDSWGPSGSYDPADPHRLLFSVDNAAGKSYLYLDGALLDTRNFAITTTTGGTNTRLGSQFEPYGELFHGTLDNVRIFDSAITPDQDTGITATPEPSTMLLAGLGVAAALIARRRSEARQ